MENLDPIIDEEDVLEADDTGEEDNGDSEDSLDPAPFGIDPETETAAIGDEAVFSGESSDPPRESFDSSEESLEQPEVSPRPSQHEVSPRPSDATPAEKTSPLTEVESAFHCYICGEPSSEICSRCTRDTCDNHICERCLLCSDCCTCDGHPR